METKREILISGFKDYISVNEINESGVILKNVFYIEKNKPLNISMRDHEEKRWSKTRITFNGEHIVCVDIDIKSDFLGMHYIIYPSDYESEFCDKVNSKPL